MSEAKSGEASTGGRLRPDPELEKLVQQLNEGTRGAAEAGEGAPAEARAAADEPALELVPGDDGEPAAEDAMPPSLSRTSQAPVIAAGDALEVLLAETVRRGASDLLLVPGSPPMLRVDGRLVAMPAAALSAESLQSLFEGHLGARHRRALRDDGAVDLTIRLPLESGHPDGRGTGWRFRVNLHRQRGHLAAALRALPRRVPTLEELHLPTTLADLVAPTRGLILVCGPTGAGKSSTLAALVGHLNRTRAAHVLTIEDPIEYEHASQKCLVEQIEVGVDAPSFAAALRAALRQDPDVILVGEMRDLETVTTALTAAETGHLILATLHTNDVVQAVHRIVDVFPAEQQAQIRQQLALALHAVVVQQLVPRRDRPGRVPAVEVLTATYAVRNHIRSEQLHRLYTEVTMGKRHGMISLEESLARLVRAGAVDPEEARIRCAHPDELDSLMRGGGAG